MVTVKSIYYSNKMDIIYSEQPDNIFLCMLRYVYLYIL